ncbi:MAG: hypothetical protein UV61_C0008G0026 [Candidatus Gottesmanbacteria bacterium GW2011_GWB1_43_11]|uniref:Uncharacterized protein n=1 Tax=Candidatus Gottesmanbacteria bacterium GW2011_GWB1_43_11 TaxID=1618446 RepID=A0A0G1FI87_9BACT|nr:MAG: hypothetical protein UV04_C0003G0027 [Candidatus Gottesmanbacteria bacterium GW2011_GWA2_42_16]KKS54169.1 MAG: hypothetical protein UV17_C0025G0026 [Candidatus Gottesmanbacteria bacterium GW2011_GWA1_42_26]KKS80742.1 MAG: hypothetical protein UV55_C0031G0019 [Candidatus Gottesmanbacteria bacterium GW2011_GWC1_43_10]KKS86573.1 MAG: hypothetical protein UV61_C0008G0026 [Candidatus Gottesmanbacteria bacterium GW2011_GWB1_43_11]OGG09746.1 MAG: hypothetical protein A2699_04280 [Candidatus Go
MSRHERRNGSKIPNRGVDELIDGHISIVYVQGEILWVSYCQGCLTPEMMEEKLRATNCFLPTHVIKGLPTFCPEHFQETPHLGL